MKLLSFAAAGRVSYGALREGGVVDLGARLGPEFPDLLSVLRAQALARIEPTVQAASIDHGLADLTLLPVIPNPGKIVCAGLNYLAHRLEGNHKPESAVPTLFLRLPQSQVGHGQPVVCPMESEQFDFEAELAVVIGRAGRRIPVEQALSHVAGMSCYNDGSVRDWQLATPQWTPGKNFPATGAFGPWLVTADELPPGSVLSLACRLNGREMQRTTTDLMMYSTAELISFISTFIALEPGDVIVTGTPGGVGLRRDPPVWMRHGDVVEVEIEGIGTLRNTVVKEGQAC